MRALRRSRAVARGWDARFGRFRSVVHEAMAHINDQLQVEPSWTSHVFAPVPSITSVSKTAVLTGMLPDQCGADLLAALMNAYRLSGAEVQLSGNWQDAERLRLAPAT